MNARYRGRQRFRSKSSQKQTREGDSNSDRGSDSKVINNITHNHNKIISPPSAFIPTMDSPFTVQCQVCLENVHISNIIRCPGGHAICGADVQRFFDRVVDGSDSYPPTCCGSALSITACAEFLEEETLEKIHQILEARIASVGKEDRQNDQTDQLFVQDSIRNGDLQVCPDCETRIYRIDGCSHMTCQMCKTEFCYHCGCVWTRCACWKAPDQPNQLAQQACPDQPDPPNEPTQPIHIDLRPRRRVFQVNPPEDPAWAILNASVGRKHGYDRDPAMCRHESRLQYRLEPGINTNCCALDTDRLQCRLCGYHHCLGCRYQPHLPDTADVATTD